MSQRIDNLVAVATALRTAVEKGVAIQTALKHKLNDAVALDITRLAAIDSLTAQLAAAQANALSPADAVAIDTLVVSFQATTQTVTDNNSVNDPAN